MTDFYHRYGTRFVTFRIIYYDTDTAKCSISKWSSGNPLIY